MPICLRVWPNESKCVSKTNLSKILVKTLPIMDFPKGPPFGSWSKIFKKFFFAKMLRNISQDGKKMFFWLNFSSKPV